VLRALGVEIVSAVSPFSLCAGSARQGSKGAEEIEDAETDLNAEIAEVAEFS